MSGLLDPLGDYVWWILGLILLVLEIVLPGVYFLFLGIAALIVGTNALILGSVGWFGWEEQVLSFVVVSAAAVLVGRNWYGAKTEGGSGPEINIGAERLIGRSALVSETIEGGRGRVAIDDGWWLAEGPDMPAGTRVVVTGVKGSTLQVAAAV